MDYHHPVIYQDHCLIAVNKPSGLLIHRSEIDKHETRFLLQELRDQLGQKVFPVHRLDKPTSGLVLFALDSETQSLLSQQFECGLINKNYWALVRGWPHASGIIDHPLKEKAVFKHQNKSQLPIKEALTHFQLLQKYEIPYAVDRYPHSRYAWLSLQPQTGRRHQLRRHLKHLSHPIIGDTYYGKTTHNQFFRDQFDCHRLMLHANSIEFVHPDNKKKLRLEAPSLDFETLLNSLKLDSQLSHG